MRLVPTTLLLLSCLYFNLLSTKINAQCNPDNEAPIANCPSDIVVECGEYTGAFQLEDQFNTAGPTGTLFAGNQFSSRANYIVTNIPGNKVDILQPQGIVVLFGALGTVGEFYTVINTIPGRSYKVLFDTKPFGDFTDHTIMVYAKDGSGTTGNILGNSIAADNDEIDVEFYFTASSTQTTLHIVGSAGGTNSSSDIAFDNLRIEESGNFTDNCNANPTVSFTDSSSPGNCGNTEIITRNYIVSDGNGNSNSCNQIITVDDTTPPSITCPSNISVNDCNATVNFSAIASDNCGITNIIYTNSPNMTFPIGSTIVTATATDDCGNSVSCNFTVTVNDMDVEPPVANCPSDVVVECGEYTGAFQLEDQFNTAGPTGTLFAGSQFSSRANYTVTNISGNKVDILQPQGIIVLFGALGTVGEFYTVTNTIPGRSYKVLFDTKPFGDFTDHTITVYAKDGSGTTGNILGNSIAADNDEIDVEFYFTASSTQTTLHIVGSVGVTNSSSDIAFDNLRVEELGDFTDNCNANPIVSFTDSSSPGNCGNTEIITRNYIVSDGNGNSNSCNQIITVEDTTPPSIACPSNISVDDCNSPINFSAMSSDNCGSFNISYTSPPNMTFPVGNTIVTATATDDCRNSMKCDFTITVNDFIAPIANCPSDVVVECGEYTGAFQLEDQFTTAGPTGTLFAGSQFSSRANYTVTNISGNKVDILQPQGIVILFGALGTVGEFYTVTNTIPGRSYKVLFDTKPFGDFTDHTITVYAKDGSGTAGNILGNSIAADNDEIDVEFYFTASSAQTTLHIVGSAGVTNSSSDIAFDNLRVEELGDFTDNCNANPIVSFTDSSSPGTNGIIEVISRTYSISDGNGNNNSCTQTITVTDTYSPSITCPTSIVSNNCNLGITFEASSNDLCGSSTVTYSHLPGSVFPIGSTLVTATATDESGNMEQCSFNVTIEDNENPTPVCLNTIVDFNGASELTVPISDLYDDLSSFDNCGTVNLISPTFDPIVDCNQVGQVIAITVEVNDSNGNTATCTANISVEGLPCGVSNTGGINCNGENTAEYDPVIEHFTLTSDACTPSFPYTSDSQSFIQFDLCGNGEIKAFIEDINGNGYAGVELRESGDPGSKKVSIATNKINKILKSIRVLDNYPAFPQEFLSYNRYWLKITRTGNLFILSAAPGTPDSEGPYTNFGYQQVLMDNCIKAGLFTFSSNGGSVTSVFSNVSVSPYGNNLQSIHTDIEQSQSKITIHAAPNPTKGEFQLNLPNVIDQQVDIKIYNINGKLMMRRQLNYSENSYEDFNISHFPSGTYIVNINSSQNNQTIKIIKQ